jgi:putative membrane protein
VNSYLLVRLLLGPRAHSAALRLPATILAVLAMDVVLDPGAVALGFWTYLAGGAFYGVPLSNYLGWVLSATVTVLVLDHGLDGTALDRRLAARAYMLDDLVSFVLLWGLVNAVYGQWIPVLVALGFGVGLLATERFDVVAFGPGRGLRARGRRWLE